MPIFLTLVLPYFTRVLSKLTFKEIMFFIGLILVLIGCVVLWTKGYQHGKSIVAEQYEKQDAKAKANADAAGYNVDQCYDAGMRWNQSTGKCE